MRKKRNRTWVAELKGVKRTAMGWKFFAKLEGKVRWSRADTGTINNDPEHRLTEPELRERWDAWRIAERARIAAGEGLYKPGDIATMLSMSRAKVYELIASGELATQVAASRLPNARYQGEARISRYAIRAWIAKRLRGSKGNGESEST